MRAEQKLKKLVKELDLSTSEELYESIAECHVNGNFSTVRDSIKELPKSYRMDCLAYVRSLGGENMEQAAKFIHNCIRSL